MTRLIFCLLSLFIVLPDAHSQTYDHPGNWGVWYKRLGADSVTTYNIQASNNIALSLRRDMYMIQAKWDSLNARFPKLSLFGSMDIGWDSTFSYVAGATYAPLGATLNIKSANNQRIPAASSDHPSVMGVKIILTGDLGAKDTLDKIAQWYSTEAFPSTMTILEDYGIHVGLGTRSGSSNPNRLRTVGVNIEDFDRGTIGNTQIFMHTGNSVDAPVGNWGIYDSLGYAHRLKGRLLVDTLITGPGRLDLKTDYNDTLCIQCNRDTATSGTVQLFYGSTFRERSGGVIGVRLAPSFVPQATTTSTNFEVLRIAPTIDQSIGHTSLTVGIQFSPTLTNAVDYNSIVSTQSSGTFMYQTNANAISKLVGMVAFGSNTTPTSKVDVIGANGYSQFRMRTSYTPTGTADANGNAGQMAWDDSFIYIKTSAGWKRAALSTF